MRSRILLAGWCGLALATSAQLAGAGECAARRARPTRAEVLLAPRLVSIAGSLALDLACPPRTDGALADRRWHDPGRAERGRGWWDGRSGSHAPDTYAILKGGGLYVADGGGTDGLYLGLELGGEVERVFDLGLSVDYFHKRTRDLQVLFDSHDYQFPVHATVTNFESSADFVPLGFTVRLKLPMATGAVTPFVSGTLAYEILHLGLVDRNRPPRPYQDLLGDSETFTGFGWQAAAGVQVAGSPSLGLFGELGLHRSSPSQSAVVNGTPVDLKVDLDGGFLRAGLRVGI